MRPKDIHGIDVTMGRWYWAKDRTGTVVGVGKFACTIGSDDYTWFINGTGYAPDGFSFWLALPARNEMSDYLTDAERRLRELHEQATPPSWAWQRFGEWALTGQHGMRPIVLTAKCRERMIQCDECGNHVCVHTQPHLTSRDAERDLLLDLDPNHPDAALVAACRNALPDLLASLSQERAENARLRKIVEQRDQQAKDTISRLVTGEGGRRAGSVTEMVAAIKYDQAKELEAENEKLRADLAHLTTEAGPDSYAALAAENARLRASAKPLAWSREEPKETGLYWMRCKKSGRVSAHLIESLALRAVGLRAYWSEFWTQHSVLCHEYEWAGPIPLPEEPQACQS